MKHYLLAIMMLLFFVGQHQRSLATLPGVLVVDNHNYWQHNDTLVDPATNAYPENGSISAAYMLCEGYIGSPLLPNAKSAIEAYQYNCEVTPPPGVTPIIDVAENHDTHSSGYPAYTIESPWTSKVYFVCDGFLNSTPWCSEAAHQKAYRLMRASMPRHWEQGEKPLIINNRPAHHVIQEQMALYQGQQHHHQLPQYNNPMTNNNYEPPSLSARSPRETENSYHKSANNQNNQHNRRSGPETAPATMNGQVITLRLSPELKGFIRDAVSESVDEAMDRHFR